MQALAPTLLFLLAAAKILAQDNMDSNLAEVFALDSRSGAARVLNLRRFNANQQEFFPRQTPGTQQISLLQANDSNKTGIITVMDIGITTLPPPIVTDAVFLDMAKFALPLFTTEEKGVLSLTTNAASGGHPTIGISTDHIRLLRSRLSGQNQSKNPQADSGLALRSNLTWSETHENYELRSIEFALPASRRIWLMFERKEDGTTGGSVLIKRIW